MNAEGTIAETKTMGGLTWTRRYTEFTTPSDYTSLTWQIGVNTYNGAIYVTGISIQAKGDTVVVSDIAIDVPAQPRVALTMTRRTYHTESDNQPLPLASHPTTRITSVEQEGDLLHISYENNPLDVYYNRVITWTDWAEERATGANWWFLDGTRDFGPRWPEQHTASSGTVTIPLPADQQGVEITVDYRTSGVSPYPQPYPNFDSVKVTTNAVSTMTGTVYVPQNHARYTILDTPYWAVTDDPQSLATAAASTDLYTGSDETKIEYTTDPFGQTELSLRTRHPHRSDLGNDFGDDNDGGFMIRFGGHYSRPAWDATKAHKLVYYFRVNENNNAGIVYFGTRGVNTKPNVNVIIDNSDVINIDNSTYQFPQELNFEDNTYIELEFDLYLDSSNTSDWSRICGIDTTYRLDALDIRMYRGSSATHKRDWGIYTYCKFGGSSYDRFFRAGNITFDNDTWYSMRIVRHSPSSRTGDILEIFINDGTGYQKVNNLLGDEAEAAGVGNNTTSVDLPARNDPRIQTWPPDGSSTLRLGWTDYKASFRNVRLLTSTDASYVSNPYFTSKYIRHFQKDKWYMCIGYVHSATALSDDSDAGVYEVDTGRKWGDVGLAESYPTATFGGTAVAGGTPKPAVGFFLSGTTYIFTVNDGSWTKMISAEWSADDGEWTLLAAKYKAKGPLNRTNVVNAWNSATTGELATSMSGSGYFVDDIKGSPYSGGNFIQDPCFTMALADNAQEFGSWGTNTIVEMSNPGESGNVLRMGPGRGGLN